MTYRSLKSKILIILKKLKLSLSSIKSYKNYIIFKYFEIKEAYFFTFKFNMRYKLIRDVTITR
jgi:hypothetical protein